MMKLFGRKNEEKKTDAPQTKAATVNDAKSSLKETKDVVKKEGSRRASVAHHVILSPIVSEKSHALTDQHTYSFQVHRDASKKNVRTAIENLYDVRVEDIRTMNMPKRKRTVGRNRGYKQAYKKALVRINKDDKIDFFEGV